LLLAFHAICTFHFWFFNIRKISHHSLLN
jgi:hypothetical protein